MRNPPVQQDWVFLNIPYDAAFERLYLAYIAGINAFQLAPHTALEIPDATRRLDRIQDLLHRCRYSIHDLSRVQVSRTAPRVPRFNMPFELGMAVNWSCMNPERHSWFVCDSEPHRVLQSMSDLNGTDINVHDGTVRGVMRELCNIFVRHSVRPDFCRADEGVPQAPLRASEHSAASGRAHALRGQDVRRSLFRGQRIRGPREKLKPDPATAYPSQTPAHSGSASSKRARAGH